MNQHPIPVVRVVLENLEGKLLLLKRTNTEYAPRQWCLPGGKVDYNEAVEDACKREVKEETGLEISDLRLLSFQDNLPISSGKMHCINLYFVARTSGDVRLNKESSEFRWILPFDYSAFNIAFGNAEGIEQYIIHYLLH